MQKQKRYVDFPDIPGVFAIYGSTQEELRLESLDTLRLFTGRAYKRLPAGTVIRTNDPYTEMANRQSGTVHRFEEWC